MHRTKRTAFVAALGLTACTMSSDGDEGTAQELSDQRCVAIGREVDSVFVVDQARRAFGTTGEELEPALIHPIRGEGIEVGVLVSLLVAGPNVPVGGGGLVWVDVDTGCAIVVKRYE